ncbi:MAG: hypothetical protein ACFNZS_05110 [Ottowia sp.]
MAFKAPHYLAAARAAWRKAVRRKACFKRAGVSSMPLILRLVVLAGQAFSIFFVFSGAFRALALMIQPFRRAFENSKKKARALKPLQASS